jgi:hypothetical protein
MCKLVTGLLNNKCKLFSGRDSPSFDDCVGQVPLDNNFKSCKETISINQDKKIICTYFKTVLNINKKDSLIMDTKTFHLTTAGRLEKE